jgi:aryl-alcohol dehydrogenase-like predicted oxidoreductase
VKLALGTVQFGLEYGIANNQGRVSELVAKAILDHAWANGINLLDTAIAYGDSEHRLGEIGIQSWQVVTKLPAIPEDCASVSAWVEDSVKQSLLRLHTTKLYGLLLHRPDQLLGEHGQTLFETLCNLKSQGFVEKIGISIYSPDELDTLCNQYVFDLIQAPFNVLDHRMIDSGWLGRLSTQGTEIHVRSVFLQGLLLMSCTKRPAFFARWQPLLSIWDAWLVENNLTPVQACLLHALSFSEISKVIVGVDSMAQLQEITTSTRGFAPSLPPELHTSDTDLLNPANWRNV